VDISRSSLALAPSHLALIDEIDTSFTSRGRTPPTFSLWGFSRRVHALGEKLSAADARAALQTARYDGGTDLSLLTPILAASSKSGCDVAVLLSDGVNNLLAKQLPDLASATSAGTTTIMPVHVALPPPGVNANLNVLRWIAHQTGGSAIESLSSPAAFADLVSGRGLVNQCQTAHYPHCPVSTDRPVPCVSLR